MTNTGRSLQQLLEALPVMKTDLVRLTLGVARERSPKLPEGPEKAENDRWIAALAAELERRTHA